MSKLTINGYVVQRLHHNIVKVEGYAPCSDIEAREILGIGKAKRQYESLENMWNKI